MFAFFCGCCVSPSEDTDERQPLLGPKLSESKEPASARKLRPTPAVSQIGPLVPKRVGVNDLDQRFSDVAETFNQQQESYDVMKEHITSLCRTFDCNHDSSQSLTECVKRIREDYEDSYRVTMVMYGYDFSLSVVLVNSAAKESVSQQPHRLRLAQEELKSISQAAKTVVAAGTKLQELIDWLLNRGQQMAEQVREAAPAHQERCRLEENLIWTIQEIRKARELSLGYRQQAGEIQTEASLVAELT